jgi:hypothetical protein
VCGAEQGKLVVDDGLNSGGNTDSSLSSVSNHAVDIDIKDSVIDGGVTVEYQDRGIGVVGDRSRVGQDDLPHDRIIIRDMLHISYTTGSKAGLPLGVRISQSFLLKSSIKQVILLGDYIELKSPSRIHDNTTIAIEPRCDTGDSSWLQPVITKSIGGVVRVPNLSPDLVSVNKNQHLAQVHYTTTTSESPPPSLPRHMNVCNIPGTQVLHSKDILVDPDHQLFTAEQQAFNKLHARYDLVFNPQIGKYNDASGHIRASINMGPVQPPSHKARLPSYNTDKLQLLQEKMDQLEELGSPG